VQSPVIRRKVRPQAQQWAAWQEGFGAGMRECSRIRRRPGEPTVDIRLEKSIHRLSRDLKLVAALRAQDASFDWRREVDNRKQAA
jgi:hypothetical protein